MKLFSNLNDYTEFTLPELQADKEDTDNFEVKFWGKEPTFLLVWLSGCKATSTAVFVAVF